MRPALAAPAALAALDAELAEVRATVSVWCGAIGSATAAYARLPDVPHYAASMMKVALFAALYRAGDAGTIDLDAPVPVRNDFESALPGAPRFTVDPAYDDDADVWARLDGAASVRWLGRRMIVRSSNLATNVLLSHVGAPAVADVLRVVGATASRVERGIGDAVARAAGIDNEVTAHDLAALLGAIEIAARAPIDPAGGDESAIASSVSCAEMIETLCAQEHRVDLAPGLPPGTRVAHKNGWVTGVRHAAGVVYPADAPPYALAVCTTAARLDDAAARALVARVAAASWADRHVIGDRPPDG